MNEELTFEDLVVKILHELEARSHWVRKRGWMIIQGVREENEVSRTASVLRASIREMRSGQQ